MFLLCGALMLNSTAGAFLQRSPPLPILQTGNDKSETLHNHQETEKMLQPCPPEVKLNSSDVQEQSQNGESGVKEETIIAQKVSRNISRTNDLECKLVPADQDDEDMSCRVLVQRELVSSKKELKIKAVDIRNQQSLSLKPKRKHLLSFLLLPRFYLIAFFLVPDPQQHDHFHDGHRGLLLWTGTCPSGTLCSSSRITP
uniref:Putative secreted protein n=1 Tax=Ixodes ricinus TaxID=34613 RepID=V5GXB5_IXORI